MFPESLCKITWHCKTATGGDVADAVRRVPQQRQALLDAIRSEVGNQCLVHVTLKQTTNFTAAQMDLIGNVLPE